MGSRGGRVEGMEGREEGEKEERKKEKIKEAIVVQPCS